MASGSIVRFRPNIGYATESITVSNSVQVLTPATYGGNTSTPGGAEVAFITNYGAAIRYYYSGSTPTASAGHVLPDGGILTLQGQNQIQDFKCIRLSGVDSEITVTYERE